jgi:hypothetical protein
MRCPLFATAFLLSGLFGFASPAPAGGSCCCEPCQTVLVPRQVTCYRCTYETRYREVKLATFVPRYETAMVERQVTVARPVVEAITREHADTVLEPVTRLVEKTVCRTTCLPDACGRLLPQCVEEKVAVPVCDYVARPVAFKITWPVCRTECEVVTQQVPVTTCHYEPHETIVQAPYVVTHRVPYTKTVWVRVCAECGCP